MGIYRKADEDPLKKVGNGFWDNKPGSSAASPSNVLTDIGINKRDPLRHVSSKSISQKKLFPPITHAGEIA